MVERVVEAGGGVGRVGRSGWANGRMGGGPSGPSKIRPIGIRLIEIRPIAIQPIEIQPIKVFGHIRKTLFFSRIFFGQKCFGHSRYHPIFKMRLQVMECLLILFRFFGYSKCSI